MKPIVISGSGIYIPPEIITNEELVSAFNEHAIKYNLDHAAEIAAGSCATAKESSTDFIAKASGIGQRHVVEKSGILDPARMAPHIRERTPEELSLQAEMGLAAAKEALKAANRRGEEIDLIIFTSLASQRAYPAIATEIQGALGAKGYGYDLLAGCSSMAVGLQAITDAIQTGHASSALLISVELGSCWTDFTDRDSHFIFGDAAVAVVIERGEISQSKNRFEILSSKISTQFSSNIRSDFGYLHRLHPAPGPIKDQLFSQQGRLVFREVIPLAVQFIQNHLLENKLTANDISRFYLHQANTNINRLILEKLCGKSFDPTQAPLTLDLYANTASAGAFLTFHLHSKDLPPHSTLLLTTFGAGYTLGSVLLRRL